MEFNFNPSLSRFKSLRDTIPSSTTWDAIATETDSLKVRKMQLKTGMPAFIASVEVEGGRTLAHVKRFTGCVMVDIDGIPAAAFAATLQKVRSDPHSFLVYTTISGCGVRVVSRVEGLTDKKTFTASWQTVNQYYATLTGIEIDAQCKNANRMSVICHDPDVQYHPAAAPFTAAEVHAQSSTPSASRRQSSPASLFPVIAAQLEKEGVRYVPGSYNAYASRCFYWMNRYGVAQSEVERWAETHFSDYPADQLRSVIKSCYALTAEHATARPSAADSRKGKAGVEEMEAFIHNYMHIRMNILTHQIEVSLIEVPQTDAPQTEKPCWERLTDQLENSLWCAMQRSGMEVDMFRLHTLLLSDFVPAYHPLLHYLEHLPAWDGTPDYIRQLGNMVHVKDTPQCTATSDSGAPSVQLDFPHIFCRWLVAMIASAHDEDVVNQIILVLIGRQGCYKTSFMQNLLPPELKEYYT